MAGLGTPYTVLMNGLGPALSSWSAGHPLHSLLGGEGYKKTVSRGNPQPSSLGTPVRLTAQLLRYTGQVHSTPVRGCQHLSPIHKPRKWWRPEAMACHSQAQAGIHSGPGLC